MRGVLRRRCREMGEQDALDLLRRASVGRLGTVGQDGYPYVVPLFFVYSGDTIYFHSARAGEKLENIRACPRVCFEVEELLEVLPSGSSPCAWTALYRSVVAFGTARLVSDRQEKVAALTGLAAKYGGRDKPLDPGAVEACEVVAVQVELMTGKCHLPQIRTEGIVRE